MSELSKRRVVSRNSPCVLLADGNCPTRLSVPSVPAILPCSGTFNKCSGESHHTLGSGGITVNPKPLPPGPVSPCCLAKGLLCALFYFSLAAADDARALAGQVLYSRLASPAPPPAYARSNHFCRQTNGSCAWAAAGPRALRAAPLHGCCEAFPADPGAKANARCVSLLDLPSP